MVDISVDCAGLQRDLYRLEIEADRNLIKVSEGQCKVLYCMGITPGTRTYWWLASGKQLWRKQFGAH